MGNRAEEDYNFVFKGEWGSPKGKPGRDPARHQPHRGPSWVCFSLTETAPGLVIWMGRLAVGRGGSGFWTGAGTADRPTLAHAGATRSLAVLGQGPWPVPSGGPHPWGQSHCSTGDGGRTSEGTSLPGEGGASRLKRKEVIFPGSVYMEKERKERSSCAGTGQRCREDVTP